VGEEDDCEYVCIDTESPDIIASDLITVVLECADSKESLPGIDASVADNCADDSTVGQSPEAGSGSYGVGESVTVTITATDECGNSSTAEVTIEFICGDHDAPAITVDSSIDVELKCADSKAPLPDVDATITDNCGVDGVAVSQSPEAGSGLYGDGETETVTVTAEDGCGNSATETVTVNFSYDCPELQAFVGAKEDLLRVWLKATALCDDANDILHDIRDLFALMQALREGVADGLGGLQDLTPFDPGAGVGGVQTAIDYIINVIWPKLQEECDQLKDKCDGFNAANDEVKDAYAELLEIFNTDCIARCNNPPPPFDLKCFICGWLGDVGENPCEFNAFGDFGQQQ
jgi:hypothetical protein